MKEKNKIIVGWLAFLFVVFHLSALFIFASPPQFGLQKGKKAVSPYVVPLFEQTWTMFAPCPVVTGKMKMKITYDSGDTEWFYPAENSRHWHQYLRGSHHGDLVILESNLLHWLKVDLEDFNLAYEGECPAYLEEAFKHGHSYFLISRYAYGWALKTKDEVPVSAEVIAELENVKTGETGDFRLPIYTW